ncbi:MAG: D-inositol-3-phosphate glycosyltransferase [Thermacetogenium sp.]|nr:D-inositol-3-phosphate glycosyltransferase [Thermacetogenium sp.]
MGFSGKMLFLSVHGDPLAKLGKIQSGGQNVYVREVVKALDSLGIAVDVFTHHSDPQVPNREPLGKNSQVIRLPAGHKGFIPKSQMLKLLPRFLNELKEHIGTGNNYTLIHSNYWHSGWVGLQLQKSYGIPRVHTSHSLGIVRKKALDADNPLFSTRLKIEKEVLQKADKVIATTPLEQKIIANYYSVKPQKISMVPCGVNTKLFRPSENNKAREILQVDKKIILFVGRFEENKGLPVLLKALDILKKNHPATLAEAMLVIVEIGRAHVRAPFLVLRCLGHGSPIILRILRTGCGRSDGLWMPRDRLPNGRPPAKCAPRQNRSARGAEKPQRPGNSPKLSSDE